MASLAAKSTAPEAARGLGNVGFIGVLVVAAVVIFGITRWIGNYYAFFAAYVVVQYIVLGTAWNILGGYTGYVNFGITAFFAIGAYSSVVLYKLTPWLPLPAMIVIGGVMAALVGLGSFPGMVIAAVTLGIVESLTATFFGPSWAPAVAFGVLLVTLAVRPNGILGR